MEADGWTGEWTDPLLEVLRKKYSNYSVNSPTGTTDRERERMGETGTRAKASEGTAEMRPSEGGRRGKVWTGEGGVRGRAR